MTDPFQHPGQSALAPVRSGLLPPALRRDLTDLNTQYLELGLAAGLSSCGDHATAPRPTDHSLAAVLQRTRDAYGLPAMAGAVVRGDSVAEIACLGVRRLGAPDTVTLADHFHIGSNVKAMTADLVAMEVEAGRLKSISHQPYKKATGLP